MHNLHELNGVKVRGTFHDFTHLVFYSPDSTFADSGQIRTGERLGYVSFEQFTGNCGVLSLFGLAIYDKRAFEAIVWMASNIHGKSVLLCSDGVDRENHEDTPVYDSVQRLREWGWDWKDATPKVPNWNMSGRLIQIWYLLLPKRTISRDDAIQTFKRI